MVSEPFTVTAAGAQCVRTLDSHAEGWVFESQADRPKS